MSAGLAHPGRRPARRRAGAAVRPAVPVAGPHRRSGSAGHHRPDAARRDPSDQRDPSGGLLRLGPSHVRLAEPGGAADLARARLGLYPDWPSQAAFAAAAVRGDYAGLLVRADRKRCPGRSAGPGGADRGWRPGQRRLHLPRGPAVPGGLRAINRELGCRGGGGAGLSATDRQRVRGPGRCGGSWCWPRPAATSRKRLRRACSSLTYLRRSGRSGAAYRRGYAATARRPGPLPGRRGPPAARAGPRRAARATDGEGRGGVLSELDEVTRWLAARAADAPDNFLYLLRLLEAEQGWAVGDFRAAVLAFRRRAARGRPAPAPVASGADRRTRGPLLSGPRRRTRRL